MTSRIDEQVRRAIIVYDPLVNGSNDVGSAGGHEAGTLVSHLLFLH